MCAVCRLLACISAGKYATVWFFGHNPLWNVSGPVERFLDARAQHLLGTMYATGKAVTKDEAEAVDTAVPPTETLL